MTRWSFSRYRYDIYLSNFGFSSLNGFSFFPIWFLSIKREWCFASHVILSEHNCRCFSLAVFLFFERGVGFPGDGEWPHHFTFLHICLPSPFPCFPLCVCLSRSLGLLRLDQVACEHNTQTLTVTGLYGSSSSSLLLFHQAGSPLDQQTAVGKANLYHWGSEIKCVLFKFSVFFSN